MSKSQRDDGAYLAHSQNPTGEVDPLRCHLRKVAARAAMFADEFGAREEAQVAGSLHDLGKYGDLFQARLAGKEHGIDHWSAGAWQALAAYRNYGLASALAIQGHHIGLQKADKQALADLKPARLKNYHPLGLRLSEPDIGRLLHRLDDDGLSLPAVMDSSLYDGLQAPPAAAMLDVRMLYSALVDADFIETEAHFEGQYRESGLSFDPGESLGALLSHIGKVSRESRSASHVNTMRSDLLGACLAAAGMPRGVFTLTAPTGSGKTLSMLAFALQHAVVHRLRRVVVVIPYLSIIDQTAKEYRAVYLERYGPATVERFILEHHSLAGTRKSTKDAVQDADANDAQDSRRRLLAENWDAPIIVTTNVQFFESLFSNRPSACRKLHNLAKSVILFDEAQSLPASLAVPTLAALTRLAERYRSTIVFATATQPAYSALSDHVKQYSYSGWDPTPIVPEDLKLFERARRTTVHWPDDPGSAVPWPDLAEIIKSCDQVLCIVNLKRHALRLLDELTHLEADGLFHLSTNMCPAHRQAKLSEIRHRLDTGKPCRLVSTQCIEAGVDVDFPSVLRALAPLDAVAQAAGRCNRNGKTATAVMQVFVPEDEGFPDAAYRQAAAVTRSLLAQLGPAGMDIHDPALYDRYYRKLYDFSRPESQNTEMLEAIRRQDFVDVAAKYRIIGDGAVNILVPYDKKGFEGLVKEVHETGLTRSWVARARPYAISMFEPRRDASVWQHLARAPLQRGEYADDWLIYLREEDYDDLRGLVPLSAMECLVG